MPAKKLKKESIEEVKEDEEVEEVLDDPATLPVEDDDAAYEEDLESDETAGEGEKAGEWTDE